MSRIAEIRRSVAESTPVLAVVGATDVVVERVRTTTSTATARAEKVQAGLEDALTTYQVELRKGLEVAQAEVGKTLAAYQIGLDPQRCSQGRPDAEGGRPAGARRRAAGARRRAAGAGAGRLPRAGGRRPGRDRLRRARRAWQAAGRAREPAEADPGPRRAGQGDAHPYPRPPSPPPARPSTTPLPLLAAPSPSAAARPARPRTSSRRSRPRSRRPSRSSPSAPAVRAPPRAAPPPPPARARPPRRRRRRPPPEAPAPRPRRPPRPPSRPRTRSATDARWSHRRLSNLNRGAASPRNHRDAALCRTLVSMLAERRLHAPVPHRARARRSARSPSRSGPWWTRCAVSAAFEAAGKLTKPPLADHSRRRGGARVPGAAGQRRGGDQLAGLPQHHRGRRRRRLPDRRATGGPGDAWPRQRGAAAAYGPGEVGSSADCERTHTQGRGAGTLTP